MVETWALSGSLTLPDGTAVAVSPFGTNDLDAIYAVESRAHCHPWQRDHFVSSLQSSHQHCLGLRHGDQWVGYAIVSCVAREAEILLIVVDTAWQGRGLGSKFLAHICSLFTQHADTVFLEVRADNQRAIQLYEDNGFNQVGIRPGYYGRGSDRADALLYACTLFEE